MKVINLLQLNGLQYESILIDEGGYDFLLPKSKYYRYYSQQLFEHGPTSREIIELKAKEKQKEYIKVQGTLQNISVGAMVEIIKNEIT